MLTNSDGIEYLEIDDSWKTRIIDEWNEKVERHLHYSDGFTIVALYENYSVGIISVYWRELPNPLRSTIEGYINILEVRPEYRRRGIARQLINISIEKAREYDAFQLRSWSSEDKVEAIPMWKKLEFGLCPATTFPRDQEVHGFFVAKLLRHESG